MDVTEDERGVSEATSVGVLVAVTVLVTASVGIGVLFVQGEGSAGVNANFTYRHFNERGAVLITHAGGDSIPAGKLVVSGPANNVTWAKLADANASSMVSKGDLVQVSPSGPYGQRISAQTTIRMVYDESEGNRTVLFSCTADCSR